MPDRPTADTITDDALDALYEQLADAKRRLGNAQSSYATLTDMARSYSERAIENGQRADRAEATITRVRALADWYADPQHRGKRGQPHPVVAAAIREALDGSCQQHPTAPHIGGMCGGCTQYPTDTTPETRRA